MNSQQISLKAVNDLRVDSSGAAQRFFIPSYQRGYRWSPLQVTQLLEDVRDFIGRSQPTPEEFYCLQPVVIKLLGDGHYEVVDGQQRLTTLLLILRHFNKRQVEEYRQALYSLEYQTRPGLANFLTDATEDSANDNADFFHFYRAIQAIEEWFRQHDSEVEDMKSALLNKTKVIWYQLADADNAVDAFTRLNVGKIPLTNDELIRALFLRRAAPEQRDAENQQLKIAYEWDQFEKGLQSDAFWYFLSNKPGKGHNRIGFLFDLIAHEELQSTSAVDDPYRVFFAFHDRLKAPGATATGEWEKIKKAYLALQEWFEDRVLYHMVGFLVSEGKSIRQIQEISEGGTKSAFELALRKEIFVLATGEGFPDEATAQSIEESVTNQVDSLSYKLHPGRIRSLLLLFNVATLLQSSRSNLRFQFDSFKNESWNIEHIRSVTDDRPERQDDRKAWLRHALEYLESQEIQLGLCSEMKAFMGLTQPEATREVFDALYNKVLNAFKESTEGETEHGIANLTLLDEHTNKSYKNAVFAVKRHRLLTLDQAGIFVPLCTRNVFLKCYSPYVGEAMFWSKKDQEGYSASIIDTLVKFFCGHQEPTA